MTTLPARKGPNSGLSLIKGRYRARYYVDGAMQMKGLGTADLKEARTLRDKLYAQMVKEGAIHVGDKERVAGSERYIYRQMPFFVKIGRKHLGGFTTFEEAREARDKALGITDNEEAEEFTI